ncbi:MAG: DNA topoisomerase II, partial [Elusimicrobiota bacterium]|nr:DNA topoisomerase II [Elusimicrobiota bacterium]
IVEKTQDGYLVKVGSQPHPSLPEHYIEWIEVATDDGRVGRKYLKPGEEPKAEFYCKAKVLFARAYCNIHGLWKSK